MNRLSHRGLRVAVLTACVLVAGCETDENPGQIVVNDTRLSDTDEPDTGTPDTDQKPGASGLIINELMSYPGDPQLSYIELLNAGDSDVDPADFQLVRVDSGNTGGQVVAMPSGTVAPGETWTIGTSGGLSDAYLATFGVRPDQFSDVVTGTGSETWVLEWDDVAVDIFGERGAETNSGSPWYYASRLALRIPKTGPSSQFDPAEWMIVEDPSLETFGEPNWAPGRFGESTFGDALFGP